MSDARELAWAAGLFEGEGSLGMKVQNPSGKNRNTYQYPVAQLAMTDEDTVRRFAAAVGVGGVTGPHACQGNRKPLYSWSVIGFERTQHVIASLWFGLGTRRQARAAEVLTTPRGRI